jgi:hypothetical protein
MLLQFVRDRVDSGYTENKHGNGKTANAPSLHGRISIGAAPPLLQ